VPVAKRKGDMMGSIVKRRKKNGEARREQSVGEKGCNGNQEQSQFKKKAVEGRSVFLE